MMKNRLLSALGSELRAARKEAGLLQADLAARIGCSIPTIRQAERGGGTLAGFLAVADRLDREIGGRSLPAGDTIGERLALLRKRRGISRRSLSAMAKVSQPTIAAIEAEASGHLASVERIAAALSAGLFLHQKGKPPSFHRTAAISSVHQAWRTPPELLEKLYPVVGGMFDLDPCSPTADRRTASVRARLYFTGRMPDDDGLALPWSGAVFVNPPYGRELKHWIQKCHDEAAARRVAPCIALIPARPDTKAWHTWIAGKADVFMLRGRLRFLAEGSDEAAPFPSALIVWNATQAIREAMRSAFPDAWHVPPHEELGGMLMV